MSGRTRPKRRQARTVTQNPVLLALQQAAMKPRSEVQARQAELQGDLQQFLNGQQCEAKWMALADCANLAEALAELGIACDQASVGAIDSAQQVLSQVYGRASATGSWTTHADEQATLRQLLWLHGVQLQHCSEGEYRKAWNNTLKRISQALGGNARAGTVIAGANHG
jgi:hypothetical protein